MPNLFAQRIVWTLTLSMSVATPGLSQAEPRAYVIATGAEGGTYYPVGVAMALLTTIHLSGPQDISLEAALSSGSRENMRMLRDSTAQFAIVQAVSGQPEADVSGDGVLRGVAMLWPDVAHFLLRTDLVETGTIADLASLTGQGFSMGPLGSGAESLTTMMLENLGFAYDTWGLVFQSYEQSVRALQDGSIAGVNISSGIGVSSVAQVMTQMGDAISLLSVTGAQAQRLAEGSGAVATTFIAGGTYPGVSDSVQTVAFPNFLAVNAHVPEEDVYWVTRVIFENLPYLCSVHPAACGITLAGALDGMPMALHPGAARYFAEAADSASGTVSGE